MKAEDPRCHRDGCGKLLSQHDENGRCENGAAFRRYPGSRNRMSQSFNRDEARVIDAMVKASYAGKPIRFDTERARKAIDGVARKTLNMLRRFREQETQPKREAG